ncbi:uncharacterized protein LOC126741153 [Anthonomus grandis grandis]|uniref:uncharacterized protein LOC126741153 n=1 Tax=Anthonomus grandis grandis TaxID=2921223 RepID=UPI002166BE13|nr:uncharacterized protein LOC126741153 [Anthonomus grandis grandis]
MEKDKSRGLKHIKDKRKYKGNSVKNPKYVPTKTQPNLGSNWERYEHSDEDEKGLTNSTDFKLLSNVPITTGSHFQFRHDQLYEGRDENDLFSLNLQALHRSMSTIPFYERVGIPKEYFPEEEIIKMEKNAQTALKSYEQFLKHNKDLATELSEKYKKILLSKSSDDEPDLVSDDISKHDSNVQGSNALLEMIDDNYEATTDSKLEPSVTKNSEEEDLEDWLEDILDKE